MKQISSILVIAAILSPLNLIAGDIKLSGFATIAGGFTAGKSQVLEGYDDKPSADKSSLFGIQASSELGKGWSATTQFLARGVDSWKLDTEWAFLSYEVTDNWRLLFGRQRAPFYIYSDFLDVSYAYHWIKPPSGVYSLVFDVFDGIGSVYNSSIGKLDSTLHVTYGRNRDPAIHLGLEENLEFSNFFAASWSISHKWLTLRSSYSRTNLTVPVTPMQSLYDGWRATPYQDVADKLEALNDLADYAGLGITFDSKNYLLVAEITRVQPGNNILPDQDSFYVSVGKHFGPVLFHFTYGEDENVADRSILSSVPQNTGTPLDELVMGTQEAFAMVEDKSAFYTFGVRWEMGESTALKAEFTRYNNKRDSANNASLLQMALTTVF